MSEYQIYKITLQPFSPLADDSTVTVVILRGKNFSFEIYTFTNITSASFESFKLLIFSLSLCSSHENPQYFSRQPCFRKPKNYFVLASWKSLPLKFSNCFVFLPYTFYMLWQREILSTLVASNFLNKF